MCDTEELKRAVEIAVLETWDSSSSFEDMARGNLIRQLKDDIDELAWEDD